MSLARYEFEQRGFGESGYNRKQWGAGNSISPAARVRRNFLSERPSNPATIRWESVLPTTCFQTVSLPVVQSLFWVQMLIRDFCWSIWMIRLNTYLYTSNNGIKPKITLILCLLKPFTAILNKYFIDGQNHKTFLVINPLKIWWLIWLALIASKRSLSR